MAILGISSSLAGSNQLFSSTPTSSTTTTTDAPSTNYSAQLSNSYQVYSPADTVTNTSTSLECTTQCVYNDLKSLQSAITDPEGSVDNTYITSLVADVDQAISDLQASPNYASDVNLQAAKAILDNVSSGIAAVADAGAPTLNDAQTTAMNNALDQAEIDIDGYEETLDDDIDFDNGDVENSLEDQIDIIEDLLDEEPNSQALAQEVYDRLDNLIAELSVAAVDSGDEGTRDQLVSDLQDMQDSLAPYVATDQTTNAEKKEDLQPFAEDIDNALSLLTSTTVLATAQVNQMGTGRELLQEVTVTTNSESDSEIKEKIPNLLKKALGRPAVEKLASMSKETVHTHYDEEKGKVYVDISQDQLIDTLANLDNTLVKEKESKDDATSTRVTKANKEAFKGFGATQPIKKTSLVPTHPKGFFLDLTS